MKRRKSHGWTGRCALPISTSASLNKPPSFVDLFFKAFLPSVIANGVAFEAHPQNTLARFDLQTRELKGFVIRDFGGLRVHPPSVIASTDLKTLDGIIDPNHSILADTTEDVHTRLYHTLIHNHLQQLIRVLGLHYNGKGWGIVRRHLEAQIPQDHELRKLWLSPETETLPGKCFMRMRLQGMYRTVSHPLHSAVARSVTRFLSICTVHSQI